MDRFANMMLSKEKSTDTREKKRGVCPPGESMLRHEEGEERRGERGEGRVPSRD